MHFENSAYAFSVYTKIICVFISSTSQSRNPTLFDSQTSRQSAAHNTDVFLFVPVEMALKTERHTSFSKQKLNGRRSLYEYSSIVEDLLSAHKLIAASERSIEEISDKHCVARNRAAFTKLWKAVARKSIEYLKSITQCSMSKTAAICRNSERTAISPSLKFLEGMSQCPSFVRFPNRNSMPFISQRLSADARAYFTAFSSFTMSDSGASC